MCDINKFYAKLTELDDYFEFVNTDIMSKLGCDIEVYAGYAAHNNLTVSTIKEWYEDAEDAFITMYNIDLYIETKYDVWKSDDLDYYYEKEVHRDGTLYECGGYWFKAD